MTTEPITPGQRRALFAFAKAQGLSVEDLRKMTPSNSISALTRADAASLLDRLNAGTAHAHPRRSPRGERRPKGVHRFATEAQHRKIEALRIDLGWSPQKLQEWLSDRHHTDGRPMTSIDSTTDAQVVIELLKAVLSRIEGRAAREEASEPQASPGYSRGNADPVLPDQAGPHPRSAATTKL